MTSNLDEARNNPRFQFRVATLLWVMTITAVIAQSPLLRSWKGLMLWLVLTAPAGMLIIYQIWRRRRHPPALPKETVTVQIDAKWVRRVKSPFIMQTVSALTGVSITFAPLFLYWAGQHKELRAYDWLFVPLCFLIIYLVPGFYMRLAGEVIGQLAKMEGPKPSPPAHPLD